MIPQKVTTYVDALFSTRRSVGKIMVGIVTAFLVAAVSACGQGGVSLPPTAKIELTDAFTGDFALTDMTGEPRSQTDFAGKPTLIFFGFTTCPDVCPAALGVISAALNELGPKADNLQPLFITVDPERDTPDVLASYLAFDERIIGLTGSIDAIERAKKGFKVYAEKAPLPGSALKYTVDHSKFLYFADETGKPLYALQDTLTPQQLASFLRAYL